jgi:hypothetical protein
VKWVLPNGGDTWSLVRKAMGREDSHPILCPKLKRTVESHSCYLDQQCSVEHITIALGTSFPPHCVGGASPHTSTSLPWGIFSLQDFLVPACLSQCGNWFLRTCTLVLAW